MADPTLTREYVARLAIGHAKGLVTEAEGKVRHYTYRMALGYASHNAEQLAYLEGKLAEARAHLREVLDANP